MHNGTLGTVQSTETRSYGNSNWLDQLTNINGTAITYDNIGNPLKWHNASSLTWEGRKLKTFTKTDGTVISYTYDENGIRTGKKIGSENVEYVLSGSKIIQEKRTNYTLTFLYDGSTLIGFNYKAGTTNADYYYGIDNFGNINYIYDSNGNVVVTYKYDAWGKLISTTGSLAGTIGVINPYRYKSYYFDSEIQMYYLQSRYYDAGVQRFISSDNPMLLGISAGVYAYNLYLYCENDPVNNSDPTGQLLWPGEIHSFVQFVMFFYLTFVLKVFTVMEYPIKYNFWKTRRADLYAPDTGEMWEIKPDKNKYYTSGLAQLNDYISHLKGSKHGRNLGVFETYYISRSGVYFVEIWSTSNDGMIYYYHEYSIKGTALLVLGAFSIALVASGVGTPLGTSIGAGILVLA